MSSVFYYNFQVGNFAIAVYLPTPFLFDCTHTGMSALLFCMFFCSQILLPFTVTIISYLLPLLFLRKLNTFIAQWILCIFFCGADTIILILRRVYGLCSHFFYVADNNALTKNNLREREFISPSRQQSIIAGSQQRCSYRIWSRNDVGKSSACWLAPWVNFSYRFLID